MAPAGRHLHSVCGKPFHLSGRGGIAAVREKLNVREDVRFVFIRRDRFPATIAFVLFGSLSIAAPAAAVSPSPPAVSPSPPAVAGGATVAAAPPATEPEVESVAGLVMEAGSGQVLYEKNARTPMPMASTTKIMTALLALEKGRLDDVVTVSSRASRVEGSRIYLEEGERETLRDLLYALLLSSANDAAIAIAEHIAGSEEAFVAMMNEKALALGARDTVFQNPHGLSSEGHYTTAHDLALIARAALRNPTFARIVSTREYRMPWPAKSSVRLLYNHNKLLWRDLSTEDFLVTGVKTGYTLAAGNCLVASARRGDRELIAVALNSGPGVEYRDVLALFRYGFGQFTPHQLVRPGEVVARPVLPGGRSIPVVTAEGLRWSLARDDTTARVQKIVELSGPIQVPVALGQQVGHLRVLIEGREVGRIGLISAASVNPPRAAGRWWAWTLGLFFLWRALSALDRWRRRARRRRRVGTLTPVPFDLDRRR